MWQNLNICSQKVSIVDEKCENLLSEMGGNIADEKCEILLFEWTVQIGKASIFRDKCCWWKMLAFVFYLVFKMAVSLPAQLSSSNGILWN